MVANFSANITAMLPPCFQGACKGGIVTDKPIDLEVVDTSGLTDADWAEIDRLKSLYETAWSKCAVEGSG